MKANRDIKLDISVNMKALDVQWCEQPRLYFRYAAELADARRDMDDAKADLDLTDAELDLAIRSSPGDYGLEKVTEAAVKAAIPAQQSHKTAHEQMLKAKHDVDVLGAAVGALDHRKKALENLVQLRLADYYSEPRAPKGARERMDDVRKKEVRQRGRAEKDDET